MRGNSTGRFLTLTTFGESHGAALGAVIDGCPAGIPLAADDFARALARRRPGQSALVSARDEADVPELLSGVFEGRTLGTPIAVLVRNRDARPGDYRGDDARVGHADATWEARYGVRDHRGGGRSSGRETVGRVIGGVVAERILPEGVRIVAFTRRIGGIACGDVPAELSRAAVDAHPTRCPDSVAAERMAEEIAACREAGDSLGGVVELWIDGAGAGLGEPVFRKATAELAAALLGIGATTAIAFGDAGEAVTLRGSAFHEQVPGASPGVARRAAGIQGGITNGERIRALVTVKPPSTTGESARRGRHDPCIVPRVVPVVEAMAALALADLWLERKLLF